MTVTFTEFDMAVRTVVTAGSSVTVSDRQHSTTGAAPLEHWTYRTASTDTIAVRVDGGHLTRTVAAQPAAGALLTGVHGSAIVPVDPFTTHRGLDDDLDALPAIDVVRVGIPWKALQPSSATFGAEATYWDAVLADIDARGYKAVLTVGTAPAWAGGSATSPPTDPADFGAWVDALLDRWVNTVEIVAMDPWNEPNSNMFFTGTDTQYLGILRAAHTAAAGRVPVSLGSIAFADLDWVETLFGLGLTGADFDTVDLHPYPLSFQGSAYWIPPELPPAEVDVPASLVAGVHALEDILASHGITGRDFIISEYGATSNPVDAASPHLRVTDTRATDWLFTAIDQASRMSSVAVFCIHEACDLGGADGWGLLREDRTWRPKRAVLT